MTFSPVEIWSLLVFVALAIFGGAVTFARGLDLDVDSPVKIRFFAELFRRLFIAAFVGVIMYFVTQVYGPQPPLAWVVASVSGVFATETLDILWLFVKKRYDSLLPASKQ